MIPFGDDFKFKDAEIQFSNMDKIIGLSFLLIILKYQDYINNKMEGVHIRYATPSEYFASLFKYHHETHFPVYQHDFFPYADNSNSYWTVGSKLKNY